jgi:hypothetical protein
MKKSTFVISLLCISVAFIMTTSCEKDYLIIEEAPTEVSYSADMQPFFDAKCVSCHNGGSIPLDLSIGNSYTKLIAGNYIDLNDPALSSLYVKLLPGESMAQYANSTERAMTLRWIEQGAKDN